MAAHVSIHQWRQQSEILDRMQVVFIVGPPKCGTTWLMTALDGHPQAVSRGECGLCSVFLPKFVDAFRAHNEHHKTCSQAFAMFRDSDVAMVLRQIYDRILLQYIADKKPPIVEPLMAVIDKTPANSQFVELLSQIYPAAKFICCDRDVRDAAVSAWFHFGRAGLAEQKTLAEYAVFYARGYYRPYIVKARVAGQRLGPDRFVEVEYADHKRDPHGQIERMLRFIGLPWDGNIVAQCVRAGDFKKQSGRTPGNEQRDSFHRKGVVGDWRNHFTPEFGEFLLRISRTPLDRPVEVWNPQAIPAHPVERHAVQSTATAVC